MMNNIDVLNESFQRRLAHTSLSFKRSIAEQINWNARLIGIKGARGTGKTTLLLQHIKQNLGKQIDQVLYVSLDSIWFNGASLSALVKEFDQKGGRYLFLDEVHKYAGWAQELKNIYDEYPSLNIVFTGSSLLEILNARADLSRRAVIYTTQGFSFREYIALETGIDLPILQLNDVLAFHTEKSRYIHEKVTPLQYLPNYLKNGYYPYYREEADLYFLRLGEVVNMMLEIELPLLRQVDIGYIKKIKQLLAIIASSVPFVPNVSKLSEKIGINRTTLLTYLHYLDEIGLTYNLFKTGEGTSLLQKPAKIYLENTNLAQLLGKENTNVGNLRETFFVNQLGYAHEVAYAEKGDFLVDNTYTFEIGGNKKSSKQIVDVPNAYIVSDELSHGFQNKIPLWLFGFLY